MALATASAVFVMALAPIKEGDGSPSVEVFEGQSRKRVKDKKGGLFGVTGMFSPMCSKTHLGCFCGAMRGSEGQESVCGGMSEC